MFFVFVASLCFSNLCINYDIKLVTFTAFEITIQIGDLFVAINIRLRLKTDNWALQLHLFDLHISLHRFVARWYCRLKKAEILNKVEIFNSLEQIGHSFFRGFMIFQENFT